MESGGVLFTAIRRFLPECDWQILVLSGREKIVILADEAHRSQYGLCARVNDTRELFYRFASNLRDALPNASFIGLTPSLPPLGRVSRNAAHCRCRSVPPPSSHPHAHREYGREHSGGLWRLHQHLRQRPVNR